MSFLAEFGDLPPEEREGARRIFLSVRQKMETWVDGRMKDLSTHVSAQAKLEAAKVAAELKQSLAENVDVHEALLKTIGGHLETLSKAGLTGQSKAAVEQMQAATKELADDTAKRRAELAKWGENLAGVVSEAVKTSLTI